ncbi:MAG: PBP1A family penicillin-binding protein [bacterium]|nr:PBP1A family penicillin-binding protein [bacterium]
MVAAFNRFSSRQTAERRARRGRQRLVAQHVARKRSRRTDKKREWAKLAIRIGVAALVLFVVGVGALFAYFTKDLPNGTELRNRAATESTKIYARDGTTILYEIYDEERRTSIPFDEIPDTVKQATIAIEDDDFYAHHGIDFRGILRAVYRNVTGQSNEGGSTITQQLVKNAILTDEHTYTRKIKELILAIEIESRFSKDEILHLYLNEIPYGSNAYGIQAAAQTFFNKEAKDLDLAQSVLLAALPQRPSTLSPYGPNTEELFARKDFILERMVKLGMISEDEADKAKSQELAFEAPNIEIKAPHFVFWVKDALVEQYGEQLVEKGGLRVTTTLDLNMQKAAEKAVKDGADRNQAQYGVSNAALTAIDPRNGQVMAHVGSRDYFNDAIDGSVDVARSLQQPGSSFKPYEYAAAFNKGYAPSTILFDVRTDFGGNYKPENYDKGQRGPISMRSALQTSLNIPAVKTTYLAGVETVLDQVHRMGITDLQDKSQYGLAVGLGAGEIKLVDHVSAFGVFANEGKKAPRNLVLKVEDPSGKILDEYTDQEGEQVLDRNVALTMSDVLSDDAARSPVFGSGSALTLPGRRNAVKTGTTENNTDGLTIGYVPQLAAGVWVGNNDNTPFPGGDGFFTAAPIWNDFMSEALKDTEAEWYPSPEPIATPKAVLAGKAGGKGEKVRISKVDGKLAPGDLPENYVEEKEFVEYHSILHYVQKDDPQGAFPSNPSSDEMYNRWEAAVSAWGKGKDQGSPPKETSPYGAAEVQPTVSIVQPAAGQEISTSNLSVVVSAQAVAGVSVVDVALDGGIVGSATAEPYTVTFGIAVPNGFHTITAVVTDKYGGKAETSIDINIKLDTQKPTADFSSAETALVTSLDASSSSDNNGIVNFSWSFGDGGAGSGKTASHTYASAGTYSVTLTVSDAAGNTATKTKSVTVAP